MTFQPKYCCLLCAAATAYALGRVPSLTFVPSEDGWMGAEAAEEREREWGNNLLVQTNLPFTWNNRLPFQPRPPLNMHLAKV